MVLIAIIGLGPAGIFTLASLPESVLRNTLVIERACIGGDISAHYGSVVANITKAEIIQTLKSIPKWANTTFSELDPYSDTQPPPLAILGKILRRVIAPDLQKVQFHTCELTGLTENPGSSSWQLTTTAGLFEAQNVVLCLGATPKTLNLPAPTIPLSIAFTQQLRDFIIPTEPVVVFGTSHSGVLVLKMLQSLGCTNVYAVYKGQEPFRIAQSPEAEGLKQEAAQIANEILTKAWGDKTPTLLNYNDFATLYRLVNKAQGVIYAIGFEPRTLSSLNTTTANPNLFHVGYCRPQMRCNDIGFTGFIRQAQELVLQLGAAGLFPAP